MGKFRDQVVLITGASSGIGEALAYEFAKRGADVVLVARRGERLKNIADSYQRATGRRFLGLVGDVTRDGDMERVVAQARKVFGRIDVVIANAGFGVVGNVEELSLSDYSRQFETNLFGVLRTVHATLEDLKKSRGRLVLMGSISGHVSIPGVSPYSMSKFAVRALAEALYFELKPSGVSVTLVSPGFIVSEIRKVDNQGVWHPEIQDTIPAWLCMPCEKAARQMIRAIWKRKQEEIITGHGKIVVFLHRHFPWLIKQIILMAGVSGRREPG